jgi:small subunit ribosomal protein S16
LSVKIRLKKFGTKNWDQWRVVVTDIRSPRDGRFIEEIGYYNPLIADEKISIKEDRLKYWVEKGAQMSERVKSLVKRSRKKAARQAPKA